MTELTDRISFFLLSIDYEVNKEYIIFMLHIFIKLWVHVLKVVPAGQKIY